MLREILSFAQFKKSMKTKRLFTFAGSFCFCNSFTHHQGWVLQTSQDDLSSSFLRGAPLKGSAVHESPVLQSGLLENVVEQ